MKGDTRTESRSMIGHTNDEGFVYKASEDLRRLRGVHKLVALRRCARRCYKDEMILF